MPSASMSICTYPGCNTLVLKGRCARHPKQDSRRYRAPYHAKWNDLRRRVLRDRPLCEYRTHCAGNAATEVDHRDNDRRNNDRANLVATCKRCHAAKTAAEDMDRAPDGRFAARR